MKRKLLAALAVTVILFNLAACGKANTETTTAAPTGITSVQDSMAAETTTAAEGTTATKTQTEVTATDAATAADQSDARTAENTTAAPTTKAPTTKAPTTKAPTTKAPTTTAQTNTFTKAQLAEFNGKSGKNAYIAYEGTVYDVTGNSSWRNGNHKYVLYAGTDITAKVNSCTKHIISFMTAQFSTYPVVGTYTG